MFAPRAHATTRYHPLLPLLPATVATAATTRYCRYCRYYPLPLLLPTERYCAPLPLLPLPARICPNPRYSTLVPSHSSGNEQIRSLTAVNASAPRLRSEGGSSIGRYPSEATRGRAHQRTRSRSSRPSSPSLRDSRDPSRSRYRSRSPPHRSFSRRRSKSPARTDSGASFSRSRSRHDTEEFRTATRRSSSTGTTSHATVTELGESSALTARPSASIGRCFTGARTTPARTSTSAPDASHLHTEPRLVLEARKRLALTLLKAAAWRSALQNCGLITRDGDIYPGLLNGFYLGMQLGSCPIWASLGRRKALRAFAHSAPRMQLRSLFHVLQSYSQIPCSYELHSVSNVTPLPHMLGCYREQQRWTTSIPSPSITGFPV